MVKILTDRKLCKKCGICAAFCPKEVYSFNELDGPKIEREEECIACDKCVIMCPEMAIEIVNGEENSGNE